MGQSDYSQCAIRGTIASTYSSSGLDTAACVGDAIASISNLTPVSSRIASSRQISSQKAPNCAMLALHSVSKLHASWRSRDVKAN